MITITQQQALWRWDRIPEKLRGVLTSEVSSDFVWTVCGDQHLPEDKIRLVSKLVGYVISGFLHPEDLAREIKNQGGFSEPIAVAIADGLNKRIFVSIRSDIDSIFNPRPDDGPVEEEGEEEIEVGPKIFEEIRAPQTRMDAANSNSSFIKNSAFQPGWSHPAPPGKADESRQPATPTAMPFDTASFGSTQDKQGKPVPRPPVPPSLMKDVGQAPTIGNMKPPVWQTPSNIARDKQNPQEVPLAFSKILPQREIPSLLRKNEGQAPPAIQQKPVAPQPAAAEPMPTPSPLGKDEGPAIIHEEPKTAPSKSAGFNFVPRPPSLSDVTLSKNIPPKPAVLEFGGQGGTPGSPTAPRVVHYSERKTPQPPKPPIQT